MLYLWYINFSGDLSNFTAEKVVPDVLSAVPPALLKVWDLYILILFIISFITKDIKKIYVNLLDHIW